MKYTKYNEFGNVIEHLHKSEYSSVVGLKIKHYDALKQIKDSNKCFGDKVREIMKRGITNNTVYARKLLEMI